MSVYSKSLMFKLRVRDWTAEHVKTFVIIIWKNKSSKIIHLKILEETYTQFP